MVMTMLWRVSAIVASKSKITSLMFFTAFRFYMNILVRF